MNFVINQYVWIGIAVVVFIAGIGIGYAIFLNTYQPEVMMTQTQLMQQLMMQSPAHKQQMLDDLSKNQEFMQQMAQHDKMMNMMMEYRIQDQWMGLGMMTRNMSAGITMESEMGQDIMMQHQQMMKQMMNDPELRQQMIDMINDMKESGMDQGLMNP